MKPAEDQPNSDLHTTAQGSATKTVTILFLLRDNQILLAMKKRGFGEGKWNGVGGKVDPEETVEQAAIRECQEEVGVTPYTLRRIGHLQFYEHSDPTFLHDCHIFTATEWEGEPRETEEMRPMWFHTSGIPYGSMWADDPLWLPHAIQGRPFKGTVTLDGDDIHHHDITIGALN